MKRFNYFKYWYIDFLRYLNAKTHRSKVCFKNKKRHTEDNSPKYRMVGKMISHPELDSVAINVDNRLRNKCAMTCDLFPRQFGERVRERGYLVAFTLAEVLVTLGIIGIVAAMTMPSLIVNYQKQQTVTRLKKSYNILYQTLVRNEADDNDIIIDASAPTIQTSIDYVETYLAPYMQIIKKCGTDTTGECEFYAKGLNGSTMSGIEHCNNTSTKIFLNDGVEIMPCITTNANYMQFYIDINGNKKPNVVGKDVFAFEYGLKTDNSLYKKLFPRFNYDTVEDHIADQENRCNKNQNGLACASLIMVDGWQMKKYYPW